MKNILLVNTKASFDLDYVFAKQAGISVYCDVLFAGEAAVKYALSSGQIDEVVYVFSESDKSLFESKVNLLNIKPLAYGGDEAEGTFEAFYESRIHAFMDEEDDLENVLSQMIGEEAANALRTACDEQLKVLEKEKGIKAKRAFTELADSPIEYENFIQGMADRVKMTNISKKMALNYLKSLLYDKLSDKYKMFPLRENTKVTFKPFSVWNQEGELKLDVVQQIKSVLSGDEVKCWFFDGGINPAQSFVGNSILGLFDDYCSSLEIIGRYSVHRDDLCVFGELKNDAQSYEIMTLMNGMSEFAQYGKMGKIMEFFMKNDNRDEAIDHLLYAMRDVDDGITICDVYALIKGLNKIRKILDQENTENVRLNFMKNVIRQDYGDLLTGEKLDTFSLIRWAYKKKFYQQCLTIIEAMIPEDMGKRGIYYYCDDEGEREKVTTLLAAEYNKLWSYERWKIDDIDHYFIKTYVREKSPRGAKSSKERQMNFAKFKVSFLDNQDDQLITAHTQCSDFTALTNAMFAYFYTGDVRNMTNHADTAETNNFDLFEDESKEIDNMTVVRECIEYFIQTYDIVCKDVADKDFKQIKISNGEVRKAAKELKNNQEKTNE